jgi:hypothetical protein
MADDVTKKNETAPVGVKIEIDLAVLDDLRKQALNVKRMGQQAADSAQVLIGRIDKLKRQATD